MQAKEHWQKIFTEKAEDAVSWYQPSADLSLQLILSTGASKNSAIIDVGAGASTLVDGLLDVGFQQISLLDISAAAFAITRQRLADKAETIRYIEADITQADLPYQAYDIWHDRAVFHFLLSEQERQAYVDKVLYSVKPGGHVIVASFAENGPEQCSGLTVKRYNADQLHAQFGQPFELISHQQEAHHTPFGTVQPFVYCYCRKR